LIFSKIMLKHHSWLSELSCFDFHEVPGIFLCATSYWNGGAKMGMYWSQLDDPLYSLYTWRYGDMCYDSKLKGLSDELTLVLSDTRELDRVPSTE